jgi:hypothetical protein
MNYSEFQKRYEEESDKIYALMVVLSEDELLHIISDPSGGHYKIWEGGDQYQIWDAFEVRGTVKSIKPLFDIVSNLSKEYLVRYHACEALFTIAHIHDDDFMGQVQYGLNSKREKVDQQEAIRQLQLKLNIDIHQT